MAGILRVLEAYSDYYGNWAIRRGAYLRNKYSKNSGSIPVELEGLFVLTQEISFRSMEKTFDIRLVWDFLLQFLNLLNRFQTNFVTRFSSRRFFLTCSC